MGSGHAHYPVTMSSSETDVFERFAAEFQLHLRADPVVGAPRDVLAGLAEVEQHYVVTLTSQRSGGDLRLVFVKPAVDTAPPDFRDVLWWLAADAWVVRQSRGELARWAREYRYPLDEEPTARLFKQHVAQNVALDRILGSAGYERLLALYDAETSGGVRS